MEPEYNHISMLDDLSTENNFRYIMQKSQISNPEHRDLLSKLNHQMSFDDVIDAVNMAPATRSSLMSHYSKPSNFYTTENEKRSTTCIYKGDEDTLRSLSVMALKVQLVSVNLVKFFFFYRLYKGYQPPSHCMKKNGNLEIVCYTEYGVKNILKLYIFSIISVVWGFIS